MRDATALECQGTSGTGRLVLHVTFTVTYGALPYL